MSQRSDHSQKLRQDHPVFRYQEAGYELSSSQITFWATFSVEPDITFRSQVSLDLPLNQASLHLEEAELHQWAFMLGLAEIPTYWKATLSPTIEIKAGSASPDTKRWLSQLLIHGLSEFYFVNQIDHATDENFMTVRWATDQTSLQNPISQLSADASQDKTLQLPLSKVLLPLGGGKDSLVALQLLQNFGLNSEALGLLVLSPASPAATAIASQSGLTVHTAQRLIDPKLIELNAQGYMNGHTPFSAYLSVLSSCAGHIFDYSHVALANERSANEGNITFHGLEVNHQWSKSFDYEQLFQQLSLSALPAPTPYYFSLLRPLYELQIAGLFADFYQHNQDILATFRSCNRGQQNNAWCLDCPKCLFAFIILSPYLPPDQLVTIFGTDLWQQANMLPFLQDLLGHGSNKPLECVGMYEETLLAGFLASQRFYAEVPTEQLPLLLKHLHQNVFPSEPDLASRSLTFLQAWNSQHAVPAGLAQFVKKSLATSQVLQSATAIANNQATTNSNLKGTS